MCIYGRLKLQAFVLPEGGINLSYCIELLYRSGFIGNFFLKNCNVCSMKISCISEKENKN